MCRIEFKIEKPSYVIVNVVDVTGNVVSTLLRDHRLAGDYHLDFDEKNLVPGNYYYKIFEAERSPFNGEIQQSSLLQAGQVKIDNMQNY